METGALLVLLCLIGFGVIYFLDSTIDIESYLASYLNILFASISILYLYRFVSRFRAVKGTERDMVVGAIQYFISSLAFEIHLLDNKKEIISHVLGLMEETGINSDQIKRFKKCSGCIYDGYKNALEESTFNYMREKKFLYK